MAILDLVLLVGLIMQNPPAVEPQGTPPSSTAPRDPALDRIRARLQEPPVVTVPQAPDPSVGPDGRPVFQVQIEASLMAPWDWLGLGAVPNYVRPTYTLTHHEFMLDVTPDLFRGVSTHPYGVPVMSVGRAIAKATGGALKRRRETKARKEVDEALAAFYAATGQSPPAKKK